MYEDRTLSCVECNQSFTFSADDQAYHAEKGYTNEPKRCPSCRQAKRSQRNGDGFGRWRWVRSSPSRNAPGRLRRLRQRHHCAFPAQRRPTRLL